MANGLCPASSGCRSVRTGVRAVSFPQCESVLVNIRGIKIAYPSNGADLKGLIKSAYHDPNPGCHSRTQRLYWSKVKGTEAARCRTDDAGLCDSLCKARVVLEVDAAQTRSMPTLGSDHLWDRGFIVTECCKTMAGRVEILDLRTLQSTG